MFGDASNKSSSQVYPAHPPHGGARESISSLRHRTFTKLPFPSTRFVKELRRKNLQGKPAKFFAPLTTMTSYNS